MPSPTPQPKTTEAFGPDTEITVEGVTMTARQAAKSIEAQDYGVDDMLNDPGELAPLAYSLGDDLTSNPENWGKRDKALRVLRTYHSRLSAARDAELAELRKEVERLKERQTELQCALAVAETEVETKRDALEAATEGQGVLDDDLWAAMKNERDAARKLADELKADNIKFRDWLAWNHGCKPGLYTDDGQLCCPHCGIDFGRMTTEEISQRFIRRTFARSRSAALSSLTDAEKGVERGK